MHIGGVVRDKSGNPLAGARVAAAGQVFEATTSAEGEFVLPDVGTEP